MKKNLLLVSLDTVRADVAYGGKFSAVNELMREGTVFLNAISTSPITPISHATVFTGLQPYNHGIRHLLKEKLNQSSLTLAEMLRSEGYYTGAVVSCPGMNSWYGFSRGFDHYDDEIPRLPDGSDPLNTVDVKIRGSALKRAEIVCARAQEWLEQRKGDMCPFFLLVHFFDAHWPYEAPIKYAGDNPYEEEVAYSDHYLNRLVNWMKEQELWDNTTVICFSDHGEDLEGWYPNDKGGIGLGHPEECGHGCLLYDQTQKVVLIVKDEDLVAGGSVNQQVRLVDIMPTVIDLLNIKSPSGYRFDGVSLLPVVRGEDLDLVAYSESFYPEEQNSVTNNKFSNVYNKQSYRIGNRYKLIMHMGNDSMLELYDLVKDPNEDHNLADTIIKLHEQSIR